MMNLLFYYAAICLSMFERTVRFRFWADIGRSGNSGAEGAGKEISWLHFPVFAQAKVPLPWIAMMIPRNSYFVKGYCVF